MRVHTHSSAHRHTHRHTCGTVPVPTRRRARPVRSLRGLRAPARAGPAGRPPCSPWRPGPAPRSGAPRTHRGRGPGARRAQPEAFPQSPSPAAPWQPGCFNLRARRGLGLELSGLAEEGWAVAIVPLWVSPQCVAGPTHLGPAFVLPGQALCARRTRPQVCIK